MPQKHIKICFIFQTFMEKAKPTTSYYVDENNYSHHVLDENNYSHHVVDESHYSPPCGGWNSLFPHLFNYLII